MYERVRAATHVPNDFLYESANNIVAIWRHRCRGFNKRRKRKQHTSNIPRSTNFFFFFIIWRRFFFFQSRSSNDILASYDYAFTVSEKRDLFFFLEYSDVMTSYVNS